VVVDVGDVAGVDHPMAARLEVADQRVEHRVHERVAEVGRVVRGDAADVEPHRVAGEERLHVPGAGVVQAQGGHGRQERVAGVTPTSVPDAPGTAPAAPPTRRAQERARWRAQSTLHRATGAPWGPMGSWWARRTSRTMITKGYLG